MSIGPRPILYLTVSVASPRRLLITPKQCMLSVLLTSENDYCSKLSIHILQIFPSLGQLIQLLREQRNLWK